MVAGMCVMVGLKGQALVIVPWSWLSDTTACLLFTPGTPAWLTAPPALISGILYWGPYKGLTATLFPSFTACYTAQKCTFLLLQEFSCKWKHYLCCIVIRCNQKGCCLEIARRKLVVLVFFCQFPTVCYCCLSSGSMRKENWWLQYTFRLIRDAVILLLSFLNASIYLWLFSWVILWIKQFPLNCKEY